MLLALPGAAFCQTSSVRPAALTAMPGLVDSNSPAWWADGQLHLINSNGTAWLSIADNQASMLEAGVDPIGIDSTDHTPIWIEAVWQDDDGTLYGWYHHEPAGVCPGTTLTAPQIGAVVSTDGGFTFTDLGIVLASGDPADCTAKNGFFVGGHGDFSVIPDRERRYFYFLFTNYGGALEGQGVALARLAFEDRNNPAGAVWKYYQGDWNEPGLGGMVTPVFPATVAWQQANADSFWGASVHWNMSLGRYVVLLNHACCEPGWPQEGIYIAFGPDLSDPSQFTAPQRLLGAAEIGFHPGWYPQVLGIGAGESDTLAGRVARLYIEGVSKWEIVFERP